MVPSANRSTEVVRITLSWFKRWGRGVFGSLAVVLLTNVTATGICGR